VQPNPKIQPLAGLIGEWTLLGAHPMLPGRIFHGRATFDWLEAGAFLTWRMRIEEPQIPDGIAVFGTDDASDEGAMIYFDIRGVSREYRWTVSGNEWRWWRNAPDFSQRMVLTISDDGQTMECKGEMSRDGANWEPDLQLTYTRAR
jgi:hypothetical protein